MKDWKGIDEPDLPNSYWEGNGKYQDQMDVLQKVIPLKGKSHNNAVEILRCATNLYYDLYNNGGCNWSVRKSERETLRRKGYKILKSMSAQEVEDVISRILSDIINKKLKPEKEVEVIG